MDKFYDNLMNIVAEHQRATRKSFAATRFLSKVLVSHGDIQTRFKVHEGEIDDAEALANTLEQIMELSESCPPITRILAAATLLGIEMLVRLVQ